MWYTVCRRFRLKKIRLVESNRGAAMHVSVTSCNPPTGLSRRVLGCQIAELPFKQFKDGLFKGAIRLESGKFVTGGRL